MDQECHLPCVNNNNCSPSPPTNCKMTPWSTCWLLLNPKDTIILGLKAALLADFKFKMRSTSPNFDNESSSPIFSPVNGTPKFDLQGSFKPFSFAAPGKYLKLKMKPVA